MGQIRWSATKIAIERIIPIQNLWPISRYRTLYLKSAEKIKIRSNFPRYDFKWTGFNLMKKEEFLSGIWSSRSFVVFHRPSSSIPRYILNLLLFSFHFGFASDCVCERKLRNCIMQLERRSTHKFNVKLAPTCRALLCLLDRQYQKSKDSMLKIFYPSITYQKLIGINWCLMPQKWSNRRVDLTLQSKGNRFF